MPIYVIDVSVIIYPSLLCFERKKQKAGKFTPIKPLDFSLLVGEHFLKCYEQFLTLERLLTKAQLVKLASLPIVLMICSTFE